MSDRKVIIWCSGVLAAESAEIKMAGFQLQEGDIRRKHEFVLFVVYLTTL
jgi:hypothetical protein